MSSVDRTKTATGKWTRGGRRIGVVLTPRTFDELKRRALADQRTISGLARLILERALEGRSR